MPNSINESSLWGIVSGTEEVPGVENTDAQRKFMARRDHALTIIVLAVDPLLYLLGDLEDPKAVLKKLKKQFQPKIWSNILQL